MFNKQFKVVSAECAALNAKLRVHSGGRLNQSDEKPVAIVRNIRQGSSDTDFFEMIMVIAGVILSFLLIGKLFSK